MVICYPSCVCFMMGSLASVYLAVSAGDYLFIWLSFELGSLSFLGILSSSSASSSSESIGKYFLPNSSANVVFFLFILMFYSGGEQVFSMFSVFPLLVKLGIPPFHFWMPNCLKGLSPLGVFIMLGPLKLPPFHALFWGGPLGEWALVLGVVSAFWGGVGGMNQTHILKMLGYSSINLSGWILASGVVDKIVPYVSWGLYSITLLGAVMNFSEVKGQGFHKKPMLLGFLVLMSGWPAGSIFTLKWLVLGSLIFSKVFFISILLSVSSVVALPMYMGVLFSSLMHPSFSGESSGLLSKGLGALLMVSYFWVGVLI